MSKTLHSVWGGNVPTNRTSNPGIISPPAVGCARKKPRPPSSCATFCARLTNALRDMKLVVIMAAMVCHASGQEAQGVPDLSPPASDGGSSLTNANALRQSMRELAHASWHQPQPPLPLSPPPLPPWLPSREVSQRGSGARCPAGCTRCGMALGHILEEARTRTPRR